VEIFRSASHIHLVGIGGIGLSAIARVLHGRGYAVSGSDRLLSPLTAALAAEGIVVHAGHRAENLGTADLVAISSAIHDDNPEVVEARRRGLPVVKREQLLPALTAGKSTIAVAGTHGKTTTSAMIAWILMQQGLDPTFIVGGVMQNLGTNARAGAGPHFVIEADEYDRTFLGLQPQVAVVTALEHDHPDCYPSFALMRAAFFDFARQLVPGGLLLVCGEDAAAGALGQEMRGRGTRVETYGLSPDYDWWATGPEPGTQPALEVWHAGRHACTCALQVPGRHNVLNGLGALAASAEVAVDPGAACGALARFRGTERRFELKGQAAGVTVIDDYAHHPTEIRVTLAAARLKYPGRTLWAVFQPHTYSRTAALFKDFVTAFGQADHVLVTPIYAAREERAADMSAAELVAAMAHPDARYVATFDQAVATLLQEAQGGDLVLTMGAGDGYRIGEQLLARLKESEGID
jgi:UDP-N-acetylmuramate--alanine ligase